MEKEITLKLYIDDAETLHALIDAAIGTSMSDDFNSTFIPMRDSLEKKISNFRNKINSQP